VRCGTYPLLFLIDPPFHRLDATSPVPTWVGPRNYRELFADPLFWRVLRNTAVYTFLTVPLSIGLGLALAVAIGSPAVVRRSQYRWREPLQERCASFIGAMGRDNCDRSYRHLAPRPRGKAIAGIIGRVLDRLRRT
jgi:hypothetical protein